MNDNFLDLYNQFMVFVEKDDEAGARKFLVDNLQKFPEEMQEKLTFAFFEEALMDKTKGMKEIAEMQKEGLEAMGKIDKAKKNLEDQIKIKNLKDKLTQ
ncbi:MAG: hypothetical protein WCG28_01480 [bacterium]